MGKLLFLILSVGQRHPVFAPLFLGLALTCTPTFATEFPFPCPQLVAGLCRGLNCLTDHLGIPKPATNLRFQIPLALNIHHNGPPLWHAADMYVASLANGTSAMPFPMQPDTSFGAQGMRILAGTESEFNFLASWMDGHGVKTRIHGNHADEMLLALWFAPERTFAVPLTEIVRNKKLSSTTYHELGVFLLSEATEKGFTTTGLSAWMHTQSQSWVLSEPFADAIALIFLAQDMARARAKVPADSSELRSLVREVKHVYSSSLIDLAKFENEYQLLKLPSARLLNVDPSHLLQFVGSYSTKKVAAIMQHSQKLQADGLARTVLEYEGGLCELPYLGDTPIGPQRKVFAFTQLSQVFAFTTKLVEETHRFLAHIQDDDSGIPTAAHAEAFEDALLTLIANHHIERGEPRAMPLYRSLLASFRPGLDKFRR